MPGRRTPPMPERLAPQWAISALTSVPEAWPGPGMDGEARRLVDDDEVRVLVHHGERDGLGLRGRGLRRRHVDRVGLAGLHALPQVPDRGSRPA